MSQKPPDLSVVTIVLNDKVGLQKTISSVKQQRGVKVEHIIVDGGSMDGSAQVSAINSSVYIESKPDGGIYPAMHRGALAATGKFLLFCNAGDVLFGEEFLSQAVQLLNRRKSSWGFGPIVEHTQRNTFTWHPIDKKASTKTIISRKSFVPFPSFLIKRNFYHEIGPLSSKYRIAGDFELISKSALKAKPGIFDIPVAIFSAGGISYTNADLAWKEEIAIRKDLLELSALKMSKEWAKYIGRWFKWRIGKIFDFLQETFFPHIISWRDKRAIAVPSEYRRFLAE